MSREKRCYCYRRNPFWGPSLGWIRISYCCQLAVQIARLFSNGLGVIFISHTLPHVLQVTDRVVVLRLGKVVRDAPTSTFDADSLLT